MAGYATLEQVGDWFIARFHGYQVLNPSNAEFDAVSHRAAEAERNKQCVKEVYQDGYRIAISIGEIMQHFRVGCDDGCQPWIHHGEEVDHYRIKLVDKTVLHTMAPSFRGIFGTKRDMYKALEEL